MVLGGPGFTLIRWSLDARAPWVPRTRYLARGGQARNVSGGRAACFSGTHVCEERL